MFHQIIQTTHPDGSPRTIELAKDCELINVTYIGHHTHYWSFTADLSREIMMEIGKAAMMGDVPYDWADAALVHEHVRAFLFQMGCEEQAKQIKSAPKRPEPKMAWHERVVLFLLGARSW